MYKINCPPSNIALFSAQHLEKYNILIFITQKGNKICYVQLCNTAHCKKSVINMGIKRIGNFKVFKNK
jgi:deoxycytidylate deaminase